MTWQLRDPVFRDALRALDLRLSGRYALAGTVGAQIHVAAAIGLEKRGPPAHAIEIVALGGADVPSSVGDVPLLRVETLGFDASIAAARSTIQIAEERYVVASPEHVLGTSLAARELLPDAKWACFVLMRTLAGRLDLEEVRGFLKRHDGTERQTLLAELAYLAA